MQKFGYGRVSVKKKKKAARKKNKSAGKRK